MHDNLRNANVTHECKLCSECRRTPSGLENTGSVSTTVSGKTCQAWSSDSPHVPNPGLLLDEIYPDGSRAAALNYCRNPDSSGDGPWCYTTDPNTEWDYCDVPYCPGMCMCLGM